MDAINFALTGRLIGQQRQHDIQCIKHDSLGARGPGLRVKSREQASQVKLAGLNQIWARLGIHKRQLLFRQLRQIPVEPLRIGDDALRVFLKRNKNTGFAACDCPVYEELQRKNGLAGTRPASDQRGAPARQSTARDLIESGDARRHLFRS